MRKTDICMAGRLGIVIGMGAIAAGVALTIAVSWPGGSEPALAAHAGAGGHGIQLECTPDPFEVNLGDTVTVTYVVRNAAGNAANIPDHDVTFTLTDDWVGDIIDPATPGDQTDTLQRHMSPDPATFTEGIDQVTYTRQFVVGLGDLLNPVVLQAEFDDEHTAQAVVPCFLQRAPTPTPTPSPTNTPVSEVEETATPPPPGPTPTPTLVSEVLGPPTGDGSSGSPPMGTALVLIGVLTLGGGTAAALAYRRIR